MKANDGVNAVECREVIRKRAFELADSGIFDDCEAVKRVLYARFLDAHLHQIFSSPFCRMDIDQRCQAARTGGALNGGAHAGGDNAKPIMSRLAERTVPTASRPLASGPRQQPRSPVTRSESAALTGAIAGLLADGREMTAMQMAQQVDAGQREVQRALREMLAGQEVRVVRRTPRCAGGRPARIFALAVPETGGADAATSLPSCWPKADLVVLRAMDAFSRHR
ncbi:hypothetical protein [Paraburkholderia guartelaensis]|uniref:hypothetical protein n=1 Tax=Paraburkholderia guartelaensis TaxID=2546446 RepID=UPI002AB6F645|nr:hypothetical protein [Paraburkholderia guartelaensis]